MTLLQKKEKSPLEMMKGYFDKDPFLWLLLVFRPKNLPSVDQIRMNTKIIKVCLWRLIWIVRQILGRSWRKQVQVEQVTNYGM